MLVYYCQLAGKSIHRHLGLSLLISMTLGLGIAACMITYTLIYFMAKDPLPDKSHNLFHIQLDNWQLNDAAISPNLPPEQVTWRDAFNIVQSAPVKYAAANALTWGMVTPDNQNIPPFLGIIRATHGDFFKLFNSPFLFGQPWSNQTQPGAPYITILSRETNQKLFNGENSVGYSLPMLGKIFTVVGVLDTWQLNPKFYDMSFGPFAKPEDLYIPLALKADLELPHGGHSHCWETDLADTYSAFLNSECVNFNLWVELDEHQPKSELLAFLDAYVSQQRALGRFAKPTNNQVMDLNQWLIYKKVVDTDFILFFLLAILFLAVCLFNTANLIATLFQAQAPHIALRRALGASQAQVLLMCLTHTIILGGISAVTGLVLSAIGIQAVIWLHPAFENLITINLTLVLVGLMLSVLASCLAGIIPSLNLARQAPALLLKS
ncbi:ABC transporter permease [Paraglaciecola aestuariivivens]